MFLLVNNIKRDISPGSYAIASFYISSGETSSAGKIKGPHIFQKSGIHLQSLGARRVT
jgi:hypothetical protein